MAAYEIPGFALGVLPANIDMSVEATYQYTAVEVGPATGAGLSGAAIVAPPSAGAACIGILQNNPQLGEAAAVMVSGVTKAQLGAGVGIGTKLMVKDSGGTLIAATSTNFAIARALENGVSGDIIAVLLLRDGKV
jgi:hypothetical protein